MSDTIHDLMKKVAAASVAELQARRKHNEAADQWNAAIGDLQAARAEMDKAIQAELGAIARASQIEEAARG